jgi:hypothetical protein
MITREQKISILQTIRILKELSVPYVIYGSGAAARNIIRLVRETVNYMPAFVIDHELQRTEVEGIQVKHVTALNGSDIKTILISSHIYGEDMKTQLKEYVVKPLYCFDCNMVEKDERYFSQIEEKFYEPKDMSVKTEICTIIPPSFIICGVQKSGTTALYNYLQEHQNIVATFAKETEFFLLDDMYKQGYGEYHSYFGFPRRDGSSISFEASPDYFAASNKVAKRIFDYKQDMKLIMIFRDPIKRAYSAWNMYRNKLNKDREHVEKYIQRRAPGASIWFDIYRDKESLNDFHVAIMQELSARTAGKVIEAGLLEVGLYAKHIKDFLKYFSREQILVLWYEDLVSRPAYLCDVITDFVGVPQYGWDKIHYVNHHKGVYANAAMDSKTLYLLHEFYKDSNEEFFDITGKRHDWL